MSNEKKKTFKPGPGVVDMDGLESFADDAFTNLVESNIREFGYSVVTSEALMGDSLVPTSYTIGFAAFGMPELLLLGVEEERSINIIRSLAQYHKRGGIVTDFKFPFKRDTSPTFILKYVHPDTAAAFIPKACEREDLPVPALQIVWSDDAGRFPWDEGSNIAQRSRQPLIFASYEPAATCFLH